MSAAAIAPQPSWLTSFDPTNPSSAAGLFNGTIADPANRATPAGFDVLAPTAATFAPAASPSQFQQALNAFTVTADTFLIQSALNGYQPLAAPAAFGSTQSYYQGLNSTAQTILTAGKSGNYGSINALA